MRGVVNIHPRETLAARVQVLRERVRAVDWRQAGVEARVALALALVRLRARSRTWADVGTGRSAVLARVVRDAVFRASWSVGDVLERHPPLEVARRVRAVAARRLRPRRVARVFLLFFAVLFATSAMVATAGGVYAWDRYRDYARGVVAPEELLARLPGGGARVYDRNGVLLYEFVDEFGGLRRPVPLAEISPWLTKATVSTEDVTFYENSGLNIRGLARAGLENFTPFHGGGFLEGTGGSSITQQLAKNIYIPREERYDRTVSRKLREVVIALELTKRYSKDQILEWYLNSISYGGIYVGVEAAADGYFGKPAKDLTLAEAALLAGIPQAPVAYDPLNNYENAKWRQGEVLDLMVRHGAITPEEADAARAEELVFRTQEKRFDILAPHFVLGPVAAEIRARFGDRALFDDGLEIVTTLDIEVQRTAEAALEKHIAANENVSGGHNGAVEVIDPKTGQILAYVGSRDYFRDDIEGRNDMVKALRSPGSTLKPFTYLMAFQKGWSTGTNILDTKTEITDPATGKLFSPTNPNEKYNGLVTAAASLGNSLNVTALKAIIFAGVPDTLALLRKSGFTTLDDPRGYGPAVTLGGADVTLGDATFAYTTLANGGVLRGQRAVVPHDEGERTIDPVVLLSVKSSRGWSHEAPAPQETRVAPASVTYMVTSVLSDPKNTCIVWSCGALEVPGRPTGHKTGTSAPFETLGTDIGDTWAFGYTPDLVVGVWIGNANKQPMRNIYSTTIAWPLWRDVIDDVSKQLSLPPKPFPRPSTVAEATLCWPSGFVASPLCPTQHRYKGLVATDVKPLQDTWWQRVTSGGSMVSVVGGSEVRLVLPASESALRTWLTSQGLLRSPGSESVAILSPGSRQRVSGVVAVTGRAAPPNAVVSVVEFGAGPTPSSWTPLQVANGPVTGTLAMWDTRSLTPGEYTLRLRTTDSTLGELHAVSTVMVGDGGAQGSSPTGILAAFGPGVSGVVTGATHAVTGYAVSNNLAEYLVEVGLGTSPSAWGVVGRGTSEVLGGNLATWSTAGLPDGTYMLRLTVRDRSGQTSQALAQVTLARGGATTPSPTRAPRDTAPFSASATPAPSPTPAN